MGCASDDAVDPDELLRAVWSVEVCVSNRKDSAKATMLIEVGRWVVYVVPHVHNPAKELHIPVIAGVYTFVDVKEAFSDLAVHCRWLFGSTI